MHDTVKQTRTTNIDLKDVNAAKNGAMVKNNSKNEIEALVSCGAAHWIKIVSANIPYPQAIPNITSHGFGKPPKRSRVIAVCMLQFRTLHSDF